jgi:hypothetical protein
MWLVLLKRAWPYIAGAVALWYVATQIYSRGELAERARWEPRLAAAEKAVAEANARSDERAEFSKRITSETDTRYADTIFRLNAERVDASRDIRTLSVRIATLAASVEQMSTLPRTASGADAASEIQRRAEEAGDGFVAVGAGCEIDAATVEAWQAWYRSQQLVHAEHLP